MATPLFTVKDYDLQSGSTTTDHAKVAEAIQAAIEFAEYYCQRTFAKYIADNDDGEQQLNSTVEIFSGKDRLNYFPRQAPVQSVTTIEWYNGSDWEAIDTDVYTATIDDDKNYIYYREGHVWWKGSHNWRITYTYGYTDVPRGLKKALYYLTKTYASATVRDSNIKSESDGEHSVTYFDTVSSSVPDEALVILNGYKRFI